MALNISKHITNNMKHRESAVAIINGNMISSAPGPHPPSQYASPTRQIIKKYEHEHDMGHGVMRIRFRKTQWK